MTHSSTANNIKLNYGRTCLIGLAFMGISAFWQLYDNIVPLILKNSFLMEETLTGVNIFPVIADIRPNSDLGKCAGLYYTFSMSAQIVTPIASGFLLEHVSYLTLFPYAAVFTLLGLLALARVRHGDTAPSSDLFADLQVN